MSLTYRALYRNCNYIHSITKPVKWNSFKNYPIRVVTSSICYQNTLPCRSFSDVKQLNSLSIRKYSTPSGPNDPLPGPEPKKGLIKRFKEMYRDYWYVLLPVHMATSAIWFGSFYYIVRSGVDIIGILQSWGISESLLAPLKDSGAGYVAVALALYKLITPLRYAVTIGGTTFAIKRLTAIGWLKPVPSREQLKVMIQEKRDNLQDRFNESKTHYKTQLKTKGSNLLEEMRHYKSEVRNMKNKEQGNEKQEKP